MALCLAGGLALASVTRAEDATLPGNPYALVVMRNVFGLNPKPLVDPNPPPDANPPPKITPNGIMSIFGQLQVLFKVAGTAKPGKPAADDSYIMSEGEMQDDIKVTQIDEKSGIVTFINHGREQKLPLVVTLPSSTAAPTTTDGAPNANQITPGGSPGASAGANGFNNRFGNRSGNNPGSADNGSGLQNNATRNNTFDAASQIPEGMTPEVQTVAIEVNRELTKQQVINGELPPLPITDLTPSDAVGTGGAPLIAPRADVPRQ